MDNKSAADSQRRPIALGHASFLRRACCLRCKNGRKAQKRTKTARRDLGIPSGENPARQEHAAAAPKGASVPAEGHRDDVVGAEKEGGWHRAYQPLPRCLPFLFLF
ncbi:unnamed protein product, partial [Ixodes persulcatus]